MPSCESVRRLARLAGRDGKLAVAERPVNPILISLSMAPHPPAWSPSAEPKDAIYPTTQGEIATSISLIQRGHYALWIGGAFRRKLDVLVDGKLVASQRDELSHANQYLPLGSVTLSAGIHSVTIRYGKADLHPGSGDPPFYLGPFVLAPPAKESVRYIAPADAQSLCGKSVDWVEAL
jgi:hypothetical protein